MGLAPAIPEGVGFGVELGIWCIILGLLVIRFGYQHTIGAVLHSLASLFDGIGFGFTVLGQHVGISLSFIGDGIRSLDNSIMHTLGYWIGRTQWAAHNVWHWTAYIAEETTNVIAELAEATYSALGYIKRYTLPALIAAAVADALKKIPWTVQKINHITTHPVEIITKTIEAATPALNQIEGSVDLLQAQVAAIDVPAITKPLPIPVPKVGDIISGAGQLWGDMRRVLGVLTPAGILGLVAATTLSTLDLGWLKCRGVNRAGKALCGLSGLLETLLGDAIDALIVTDLCQFTEALAYAARKFEPILLDFVNVEDALIGCGGASKPPMPAIGPLSLPPVTGYVLS